MADAKGAYIGGVPVQFKDAAARAMISDEYNSAETYAKGNLCIYNGKIYEAIKETTGTWDATAWEETTLAKVNGKLNGDITQLTENKANKDHSHAWSTITGKPSTFSPSSHTHDDRYYTKSEIGNKTSITIKDYTITLNKITSPTEKNYTIDVSLSGYTPIIAVGADAGNVDNNIFYCKITERNKVTIGIKQGYTGDSAIKAGITVMYLHN